MYQAEHAQHYMHIDLNLKSYCFTKHKMHRETMYNVVLADDQDTDRPPNDINFLDTKCEELFL